MNRSSGVLMAMSSLPSNYGIGTMGKCAYKFVDFLKAAGQKYWQFLPLGTTSYGDSPYQSFSSFAGNPYYIDLDLLIKDGLLKRSELEGIDWGSDPEHVDYGRIFENRYRVLRLAYERGAEKLSAELESFRRENGWLENYALYMSLKSHFGMLSWTEWPEEDIRLHKPEAVAEYSELLRDEIAFHVFIQYLFFKQWDALRSYAREAGVSFIGDIPIYVPLDSADVWSEPRFFQLDKDNVPTEVAGVPPDDFTEDGQLWGNPLYDWVTMEKDGYGWWLSRLGHALTTYDAVRIDHFRAFASYWAVDAQAETAKVGQWLPGPGMKLFDKVFEVYPNAPIIAEDLGVFGEDVVQLLADTGFPGMKVVQFGFDPNGDSSHMPHNAEKNSVNYVGTHDNNTLLGWLWEAGEAERRFALDYAGFTGDNWGDGGYQSPACRKIIETVWRSASNVVIIALQDMCGFGSDARMNTPGVPEKNWRFRTTEDTIANIDGAYFRRINSLFRRTYPVFEK